MTLALRNSPQSRWAESGEVFGYYDGYVLFDNPFSGALSYNSGTVRQNPLEAGGTPT